MLKARQKGYKVLPENIFRENKGMSESDLSNKSAHRQYVNICVFMIVKIFTIWILWEICVLPTKYSQLTGLCSSLYSVKL